MDVQGAYIPACSTAPVVPAAFPAEPRVCPVVNCAHGRGGGEGRARCLLLGKRGEAAQCGADRPIRSPFQRRSRPAVLVEGHGSPVVNCAQRTGGVSRGRRRSLLLGKRAEAEERRLAGELSSRGSGADGWRCVRALTWWRRRAAHRPRDGLGPLCRASRPRYCARARTAPAAEFRAGVGLGCPSRTARRWISWVASVGRSSNPSAPVFVRPRPSSSLLRPGQTDREP